MRVSYPAANPLNPVSARTASPPDAIKVCVGRRGVEDVEEDTSLSKDSGGKEDDNEVMLGRTLLLEETIAEDLVLLLHHLVRPRPAPLPTVVLHSDRARDITATCKKALPNS